MRYTLLSLFITNFLFIFNGGFSAPSKYEGMIIRKIEFVGLKNVDPDDLLIELEQNETDIGFPLKASEVRDAIKLLFKKGQFEDVIAEVEEYRDGVRLRFVCKERPTISNIEFRGTDEVGELYSRGPMLFDEYFKMPDKTASSFIGEWFSAGDMAKRDIDGFYYISNA